MTENQKYQAIKIYNVISEQYFAEWYGLDTNVDNTTYGDFDAHIKGDENCKDKNAILEQIVLMFDL